MFEYVREIVAAVEADESVKSRAEALEKLRPLGLEHFGEVLWSMPNPSFPKLSGLLPRMASPSVQRSWTGVDGAVLLKRSAEFVRSLAYNFTSISGLSLETARILDYGCGYGRLARLMYKFAPEERVIGVDPWTQSIHISTEDGLRNFYLSAYLPRELPVTGRFHLIYAFSVFTHLSKRATLQAIKTLRSYVHDGGVLAITIRPVEYWAEQHKEMAEIRQREHRDAGFAFCPHDRPPVDGDITYGDTSMTTQWLADNCSEWRLVAEDWTMEDAQQRYLFLQPLY